MQIARTTLPGVLVVEPDVHRDPRGFLLESYHRQRYVDAGIPDVFVQDNHSCSCSGTLRGLHLQRTKLQAKLVRTIRGEIFDVAVDVRVGSPTFGQWVAELLSADNFRQLYIPAGFAHGLCVLSDEAQLHYKCSNFYDADDELSIAYDDPDIGIEWPVPDPLLSERDRNGQRLRDALDLLPRHDP